MKETKDVYAYDVVPKSNTEKRLQAYRNSLLEKQKKNKQKKRG